MDCKQQTPWLQESAIRVHGISVIAWALDSSGLVSWFTLFALPDRDVLVSLSDSLRYFPLVQSSDGDFPTGRRYETPNSPRGGFLQHFLSKSPHPLGSFFRVPLFASFKTQSSRLQTQLFTWDCGVPADTGSSFPVTSRLPRTYFVERGPTSFLVIAHCPKA